MALDTGKEGWSRLLEPGLRKIFFESWKEREPQYTKVFNMNTSKKHAEHDISLTGFGEWQERTSEHSSVPYDDPQEGFKVDYLHSEFLKGFKVTRAMVDDEMYNQINKLPANMSRAGRAKVETDAASILNKGFSNNGYDGSSLFATDHALKRAKGAKGSNLVTVDNVTQDSDVLNEDILNDAILLARKTTDDAGLKIVVSPQFLVVPPELEVQANRVVNTPQRTGTNWNDINTIRGKLQVIVMDYMDMPNSYFLLDKNISELEFFWRVRPQFGSDNSFDTLEAKYRGYMRYSVGYSNWRGVVGVQGTASTSAAAKTPVREQIIVTPELQKQLDKIPQLESMIAELNKEKAETGTPAPETPENKAATPEGSEKPQNKKSK